MAGSRSSRQREIVVEPPVPRGPARLRPASAPLLLETAPILRVRVLARGRGPAARGIDKGTTIPDTNDTAGPRRTADLLETWREADRAHRTARQLLVAATRASEAALRAAEAAERTADVATKALEAATSSAETAHASAREAREAADAAGLHVTGSDGDHAAAREAADVAQRAYREHVDKASRA